MEIPYGFSERLKVKSIIPASIPVIIRLMEKVVDEEKTASETENIAPIENSEESEKNDSQIIPDTTDNNSDLQIDNNTQTGSDSANIEAIETEPTNASAASLIPNSD